MSFLIPTIADVLAAESIIWQHVSPAPLIRARKRIAAIEITPENRTSWS